MKIKTIYVEDKIKDHKNTKQIISRINYENLIYCEHYSEIFNPSNQNFRIQKKFPSLILAKKDGNLVHEAPKDFSIGYKNNYYFSHMFNCLYDCKYCYLQGMLNSANYLIFVNYEDFLNKIKKIILKNQDTTCFFSGYDCDSLALEKITRFVEKSINYFEKMNKGILEIRSKSINIEVLKKRKPLPNVIPAFSLNPQFVINNFEDKTPSLLKRLNAISTLQKNEWYVGLRFDPIVWNDSDERYISFFNKVFKTIDIGKVHSVTLGNFRMPSTYLKKISKIRPDNYFIQFENSKRVLNLEKEKKNEKTELCIKQISKFVDKSKIFLN